MLLDWTGCHLAGSGPWFRCPGCARRVAIVYAPGSRFLCRHCLDLTYAVSQEKPADRVLRKAQNIQHRLGGDGNMFDFFPEKPKGMHCRTYDRWLRRPMRRVGRNSPGW